jgi:DNA-binding CsgD family transcriptional regulator
MTPEQGLEYAAVGLLERDRELAEQRGLLDGVVAGAGALLVIQGPAGAGKTRLLKAARAEAVKRGLTVLAARGGELEREFPFGVARQLLEPAVARAEAAERRALLTGAAALAGPALALEVGTLGTPSEARFAALHGLYWLSVNLADRAPLFIAVDDLHWVDPASLHWLAYLAARLEGLPALLAVAVRTGERDTDSELIHAITSNAAARAQFPMPLSEAGVAEMISRSLGPPHPEFTTACHTATNGNPFMLNELLGALSADGIDPGAEASTRVASLGPATVARATFLRVAQLPAGADAIARAVAILGIDAELRHAAALAQLDQRTAAVAVDALVSAGILGPGRPLDFVHPIVRAAVYADLPAGQRGLAHRDAARMLAAEDAGVARVAAHLLATEPAGDHEVVPILRQAAHEALRTGATGAAIAYLRRALQEPAPRPVRPGLLLELGEAERHAGDSAAVGHLAGAADEAPEPRSRTQALRELGRACVLEGRMVEAASAWERAIDEARGELPALAHEIEAELIGLGQMGMLSGYSVAERVARLRRDELRPADRGTRMLLGVAAFEALRRAEPAATTVALAEAALSAGAIAEPVLDSAPHYLALLALLYADRYDVAGQRCAQELAHARARGSVSGFMVVCITTADLAYRQGRLADAESDALSVLEIAAGENVLVRSVASAVLADCQLARGRRHEAAATLAETGAMDLPPEHLLHALLHTRGTFKAASGHARDGLSDLLACGRLLTASGSLNPAQVPWRSSAARIHAALGERDHARKLSDEEVELARSFGAPRALGAALRTAGHVAGSAAGLELLSEAVATLEGSGADLELAHALIDRGAALRRARHRADAQIPLRRGLDLAHRCGAAVLASRARDELTATGARPRRPALTGIDSLSPRERRVAQLAAQGLTNREIAQALFVTLKTVETHLGHCYQKLDITSRAQLPTELTRRGEPGI